MSKNRPVRQGLSQGPQKLINQFPLFKYSWADIHGKIRISRTIYSASEKASLTVNCVKVLNSQLFLGTRKSPPNIKTKEFC